MKQYILIALLYLPLSIHAQELLVDENDTTIMSEYNDGRVWAYKQIGDFVVGMTNYVDKDDYGKNYQIAIFIKNLGNMPVTFDPSLVTSILYFKNGEPEDLKVYTYESYMKKIKRIQAWSIALTSFSTGLSAGMAGYQTTYTTSYRQGVPYTQAHTTYNYAAASAANTAATTQLMTLSQMMSNDKNTISQGYLKMTTIHPDEAIIGYMNIKYRKGNHMIVNIPIGTEVYSFKWDVTKKKK